jgi:5'-nucleotidase / UDP-sugar diphosphatase
MARMIGLAIGAIAAVLVCLPGHCQAAVVNVSVLYTGDTHGHLKSFYYDSAKPVGGVAKRAIYFQDRRKHAKMNWVVLDSGDAISGTALSDLFQGYIDIEAMNRLGYDAMGLGVHEFDYGVAVLKQRMSEAKFPILCANVTYADTGKPFAKPYTIIERDGMKIAILGLTTGEIDKRVAPENFTGLTVADPIETARALVPKLHKEAELVFVVTHLGVNEDIRLATQVPGIDLIVGGMSNSELQEGIFALDALIVHGGSFGRYVGQLKLSYDHNEAGKLMRRFNENELQLMDGRYADNSNYTAWLNSFQPQVQEKMGTLIGSSAARMDNRMVASFETELGNYVCDVLKSSLNADAAILPAAFFNASLPEGVITLSELYALMPFDHYGVVVNITGSELQRVLNEAADNLGKPGFSQVSGLTYDIYAGKAYAAQVNGQPIDPYGRYRLATSDYVASGALGYAALGTIDDVQYSGRLIRDIVRQQLGSGQVASATIHKRIRLVASAPEGAPPTGGQPPAEESTATTPPSDETATAPSDESATPAAAPPVDETPADTTPAEPGTEQPPAEPGTTRYDRTGAPMGEQPAIEDEVITDSGSDLPTAEQPSTTPAEPLPPSTAPAEEPASTSDTSGETIGQARASQGGLDYEFYLVKENGGYKFHLNVVNNGTETVQLQFPTAERFDIQVYTGTNLMWSYNFNRFFVQSQQSETLAPGDKRTYRGDWNGMTNDDQLIADEMLEFIGIYAVSDAPVQLSFNARLPK